MQGQRYIVSLSLWVLSITPFKCVILFYLPIPAACHSQDRPTAAVTPIQSATPVTYLPHLAVCPPPSNSSAQGCSRAGVAMGCAAASLTPPNVSAASLDSDALRPVPILTVPVGPVNSSALIPAANSTALACRMDKDVKVGWIFEYIITISCCRYVWSLRRIYLLFVLVSYDELVRWMKCLVVIGNVWDSSWHLCGCKSRWQDSVINKERLLSCTVCSRLSVFRSFHKRTVVMMFHIYKLRFKSCLCSE